MAKNSSPKSKDEWVTICDEYLELKEQKKDLTIKGFCNMRDSLKYNTARVKMPKLLKEIKERSIDDQRKILPNGKKSRVHNDRTHKEYLAKKDSSTAKGHGVYSKYFDPDLLDLAASGSLNDDLVLYRAKALKALDYLQELQLELDKAVAKNDSEAVEIMEKRIITGDKALSWCITRIESLAMSVKKIELTSVLIVKERANVVKTKAVTRATLHQSNKYKADAKLAKAKTYELEHGNKGDVATDIVKDLQSRRDSLPSFAKQKEAIK